MYSSTDITCIEVFWLQSETLSDVVEGVTTESAGWVGRRTPNCRSVSSNDEGRTTKRILCPLPTLLNISCSLHERMNPWWWCEMSAERRWSSLREGKSMPLSTSSALWCRCRCCDGVAAGWVNTSPWWYGRTDGMLLSVPLLVFVSFEFCFGFTALAFMY